MHIRSGGSREEAREARPPLISRPNRPKKFFLETGLPPLSKSLDDRPPLSQGLDPPLIRNTYSLTVFLLAKSSQLGKTTD